MLPLPNTCNMNMGDKVSRQEDKIHLFFGVKRTEEKKGVSLKIKPKQSYNVNINHHIMTCHLRVIHGFQEKRWKKLFILPLQKVGGPSGASSCTPTRAGAGPVKGGKTKKAEDL